MHLLFSLYLPLLPLEALRPSWSDPGACAVMSKDQVLVASPAAAKLGIRAGMRAGGVLALAPDTLLHERDPERERTALDAIVLALSRFTPDIALEPDGGILLNIGASLRLFGGPRRLAAEVQACLRTLGYTARLAMAPTAAGAWLLARAPKRRGAGQRHRCLRLGTLARLLDRLPCTLLPAAHAHAEWLDGVGARDLAALRRLPRAGLIRRTSTHLTDALDRAYGTGAELFQWLALPDTFSAHIETFERVEHAEALLHGATGLILQMTGWLTARQLAVAIFALLLEHERGRQAIAPTTLEIALAEPAWKEGHLLLLLKERLAKVELVAPVIGLRLDALRVVPMAPPNASLFPEPGGSPQDVLHLMELLAARLGPENVLMPAPAADHRPEVCNAWAPATERLRKLIDNAELPLRPFWLLAQPIKLLLREERPFYGSPLKLVRGPERIEAGWWNDQVAARDYYVAQGADGACFWIFQERTGEQRWFLHGLYA